MLINRNGIIAVLLLCATVTFCVGEGRAETFVVAGHLLNLVPPEGYCQASKQSEEGPLIEVLESAMTDNVLLMVFVDCKELRAFRKGLADGFGHYGQYAAPRNSKGKVVILPTGMSQPELMRQVLADFKVADNQAALDKAADRARSYYPELKSGESKSFGVIESQEEAIYVGSSMRIREQDGIVRYVAHVYGMTVLSGVLVTSYLFERSVTLPDIAPLLVRQKANVRLLRSSNP